MRKSLGILVVVIAGFFTSVAQTVPAPVEMAHWELCEAGDSAFEDPKAWVPLPDFPVVFSNKLSAVWVRTKVRNETGEAKSLRVITKGIDSLNAYLEINGTVNTHITGKYIPLGSRLIPSQFLTVPVDIPAHTEGRVTLRIYNQGYQLSLPYLKILDEKNTYQFIKTGELGYYIYFGGIVLMTLFSIILFLFFRERLYLFYFACLVCSFLLAFCYNDLYYLVWDTSPGFVRNKNIFAVLTTVLNCIYLLFAEQYLKVDTRTNSLLLKISRIIIGILMLELVVLIALNKELYYFRILFYPLFGANVSIMYYYLIVSIQKKYPPSWFFLIASTPVAFVSVLEITSDFNGVPVQTMHDIYYAGTFIEMFFLTIGIVFRFRIEKTNAQNLQNALFESETRIQEKIKEDIAKDLHGNINTAIVTTLHNLREFADHFFSGKKAPINLTKALSSLEKTSDDVRKLSHQLQPQVLSNLGLVMELKEKYGHMTNPVFKLSMSEESVKLDSFTELTLYAVINEAVQNILRHARATEIGIELVEIKGYVNLRIEDNGIGFDMGNVSSTGMGLNNIRSKAGNQLNGRCRIESSPGNGTIISIRFKKRSLSRI